MNEYTSTLPDPIVSRRQASKRKFLKDIQWVAYRYLALKQYNRVEVTMKFHLVDGAKFDTAPMTDPFPEISKHSPLPYPIPGPVIVHLTINNTQTNRQDPVQEWRIATAHASEQDRTKLSLTFDRIRRFLAGVFSTEDRELARDLDKVHTFEATIILRDPSGVYGVLHGTSADITFEQSKMSSDSGALKYILDHPLLVGA